jgi:hypothetical protein
MTDHALTPEELAAMQARTPRPRANTFFNRIVHGRTTGDQLTKLEATAAADQDHRTPEAGAPRVYTPREVNQARGIGYAMREGYRRAAWLDRKLTTEAEALDAPAYDWKPARPTRGARR